MLRRSDANSRLIAIAAIVLVAFLWGLSFLSTKVLLTELPPMRIAFTRFLAASILLGLAMRKREPGSKLAIKDAGYVALVGFLGTTLYFVCENTGLKYTTASNAVLIIAAVPALSMAVQVLVHKAPISPLAVFGVVISMLGVAFVVGPDSLSLTSDKALGNLLVLAAAVSWVAFNEAAKPLFARYSKLALTTFSTWFGTAFLLPLALSDKQPWTLPSASALLNLGYLAVLCSALAYFLYLMALGRLGSTTVTSYLNIVPVVGVAGSVAFLGERLGVLQAVGGLVIIAGITLVTYADSSQRACPSP